MNSKYLLIDKKNNFSIPLNSGTDRTTAINMANNYLLLTGAVTVELWENGKFLMRVNWA